MVQKQLRRNSRTTTITVDRETAETVRKIVGQLQYLSGRRVTQGEVVNQALELYLQKLKEDAA